jgi:hypothetical protein
MKGKTYEELYGVKKAKNLRNIHKRNAIKNNAGEILKRITLQNKGKTYKQIYGIEQAAKMQKHLSTVLTGKPGLTGKQNPQFGKPPHQGSGNGWSGWYKNWYFRSIKELSFMINYIEKNNHTWKSAEISEYAIPYIYFDGAERHYFADFIVNNNLLVEVKPLSLVNTPLVQLKSRAAIKWCNSKKIKYQIFTEKQFDILNFQDIIKLHTMKQIKWLPRYQIKFKERVSQCA